MPENVTLLCRDTQVLTLWKMAILFMSLPHPHFTFYQKSKELPVMAHGCSSFWPFLSLLNEHPWWEKIKYELYNFAKIGNPPNNGRLPVGFRVGLEYNFIFVLTWTKLVPSFICLRWKRPLITIMYIDIWGGASTSFWNIFFFVINYCK